MQNSASVMMYGTVRPMAGISVRLMSKALRSLSNAQLTGQGGQKEWSDAIEATDDQLARGSDRETTYPYPATNNDNPNVAGTCATPKYCMASKIPGL